MVNPRDKKYYENEAKECFKNLYNYEGSIKDEEAKTRKFLVRKYNLNLVQSLKKGRFKNIYDCLKEFEKEMQLDNEVFKNLNI